MSAPKKIISILIKALIGVASFYLIWMKLKDDLNSERLNAISESVLSMKGALFLLTTIVLLFLNWGLESYKWMLITAQVEKVNFYTAQRSVYSGIFLGNLAPGRATEFLAKIFYFRKENRPQISVLHFVNGMFQLSVTYLIGFSALALQFNSLNGDSVWIAWTSLATSIFVMCLFLLSIVNIDKLLHYAAKKVLGKEQDTPFHFRFGTPLLVKLFSLSIIRYSVFYLQMLLLLALFSGQFSVEVMSGISIYFLITTSIPMISFLEGAIRAAIALFVFRGCGISDSALALASLSVWIVNIIIPSTIGYLFLLQQQFDFRISKAGTR